MSVMLVDEYLPVYDVSDAVATVVETDVATVWDALMDVDLIDVGRRRPLVGILGAVRVLPEVVLRLLKGEAPPRAPARLRLRDMATLPRKEGGWILLGERPRDEIALGLVGRFWMPESSRASSSLIMSRSTRESTAARAFGSPLIQKFIVSAATNFGRSTWSSTLVWSAGWMFPRSTKGLDL